MFSDVYSFDSISDDPSCTCGCKYLTKHKYEDTLIEGCPLCLTYVLLSLELRRKGKNYPPSQILLKVFPHGNWRTLYVLINK